jgi:hypothetical protein
VDIDAKNHALKIVLRAKNCAKLSALTVNVLNSVEKFAIFVLSHARLVVNILSALKNALSLAITNYAMNHAQSCSPVATLALVCAAWTALICASCASPMIPISMRISN